MNRCFQSIILLVLPVILICLSITASPAAKAKRVLLISSYHPAFPTFFQQTEGVRSTFAGHDILLDVEFMDSKRFMDDENLQRFSETLLYKLEHLPPYDLILSVSRGIGDRLRLESLAGINGICIMESRAYSFPDQAVHWRRGLSIIILPLQYIILHQKWGFALLANMQALTSGTVNPTNLRLNRVIP